MPELLGPAKTVAAVDIGANSIRMVMAEVTPNGQIEVLERLQRAVRLGQDTFRRGRLGGQSMRAALDVLRDFRQLLKLYQVERVRAVATSAVREASNADLFLDRVYLSTGLHVEIIDTSEESRLTVSAVRQALADILHDDHRETLIVDVGGGSTLLTLIRGTEIVTSQGLRLGSIRLQELLHTSEEPPARSAELLRLHVTNIITALQGSMDFASVQRLVAVGGDARFAARQIGQPTESADLVTIETKDFDALVDRCEQHTAEDLSKRYGMPFAEAETLNPALIVYQVLLHKTQANKVTVSHVSMRDGLLLELAREVTGKEDESLLAGVIHSALTLAEKYRADLEHARCVADLTMRLFDATQSDHGLSPRHRLLLRVAALLHEVGSFVSNRSHHKHSEYLIANSEIFGLSRGEIQIVAEIARYHRRSTPRPAHLNYMALSREARVTVNKLAAILRVADALSRGSATRMRDLRVERVDDDLVLVVPGAGDLMLERRSIAAKGDLFEEIYGMRIRLEEA